MDQSVKTPSIWSEDDQALWLNPSLAAAGRNCGEGSGGGPGGDNTDLGVAGVGCGTGSGGGPGVTDNTDLGAARVFCGTGNGGAPGATVIDAENAAKVLVAGGARLSRKQRARRAEASKEAILANALQDGKLSNASDQRIWHEGEVAVSRLSSAGIFDVSNTSWRDTMSVLGRAGVELAQRVGEGSVVCLALVFQGTTLCRDLDDVAVEEIVAAVAAVGKPGTGARRCSLVA